MSTRWIKDWVAPQAAARAQGKPGQQTAFTRRGGLVADNRARPGEAARNSRMSAGAAALAIHLKGDRDETS